jgi:hypothetical protein
MLNGALCVTWLFGATVAFRQDGLGQGLMALLIPPYGWYVAWNDWTSVSRGEAPGARWLDPRFEATVVELSTLCAANDADRASSGLEPRQYDEYCLCVARAVIDIRTPAELDFQRRTGTASVDFRRRVARARGSCAGTARFVRPLPPAQDNVSPPGP